MMNSKFPYASAPVHPFTDVEVCEWVMKISREDICKHPNPKLKIGIIEDDVQCMLKYLLDILGGIMQSLEQGHKHVIILGAPDPQYALLAQMINQLNVSCKHVHTFNMDEYADENGNTAPANHPGGFQYWMWQDLFNRIKPELAIPPEQVHFPSTANIHHYTRMMEDMGGADVCYGGCGWNGHIAFFEPHVGARFGDDMDAFMQQGAQIVDLHPLTIAQNSLFCDAGASGAWHRVPPKAATIGPKDLVNSKVNKCYHFISYGDVSWHRFISRLMIHGPVTPKVPGSLYQVIGADMWLSGKVAADISTRQIAERRIAYADIRK
jgi:glucosamine-6-phosphate deaminase